MVVDGKAYITDRDKANQFAKTYKSYSLLPARKEDRAIRKHVLEVHEVEKDYARDRG